MFSSIDRSGMCELTFPMISLDLLANTLIHATVQCLQFKKKTNVWSKFAARVAKIRGKQLSPFCSCNQHVYISILRWSSALCFTPYLGLPTFCWCAWYSGWYSASWESIFLAGNSTSVLTNAASNMTLLWCQIRPYAFRGETAGLTLMSTLIILETDS